MKKTCMALISLLLTLSLVLGGCGMVDFKGYFENLSGILSGQPTAFENMQYTRPDMEKFQTVLDASLQTAETGTDLDTVLNCVYDFYGVYNSFCTNYALSNIHYSLDLTDSYWEEEYNFCSEQTVTADAGLDSLYRALAKSPIRAQLEQDAYFGPGFFTAYEGQSLYDEYFQGLLTQEAELQNEYYAISAKAATMDYYSEAFFSTYGAQLADIYVQMISLRQKMAEHAGFSSYPDFAYNYYFGRDYSCLNAAEYLSQIREHLAPLYIRLAQSGQLEDGYAPCSSKDTFDYVKNTAQTMGGVIWEAFQAMEAGNLYDISYSTKKFSNSFEVYLYDYSAPFVFMCPSNTTYDKLTFTHEFGHFCNDYASYGAKPGIDVAEVFSQGMEYLSLCYNPDPQLTKLKMADSLQVYVGQAIYALFELRVYELKGSQLTADNVRKVYEDTVREFGLGAPGWDSREYVLIPHFFVSPMYVISYVVSNDAALQLYMLEKEEAGKGLACLQNNLTTRHSGIQTFIREAGLKSSPFADGWVEQVKKTMEQILFG